MTIFSTHPLMFLRELAFELKDEEVDRAQIFEIISHVAETQLKPVLVELGKSKNLSDAAQKIVSKKLAELQEDSFSEVTESKE